VRRCSAQVAMTISSAEIKKVILTEDDFGHEMRVGSILNAIQTQIVSQRHIERISVELELGGTYTDPSMGKPRQFDYRCKVDKIDGSTSKLNRDSLLIAAECKNLHPSSPLVITGRMRAENEAFHTFVEWSSNDGSKITKIGRSRLYPPGEFVGKNFLRVKKDLKSQIKIDTQPDIYDRWSQAIHSSFDLARHAHATQTRLQCDRVRSIILPIVVVPDESLWRVSYNDDGKLADEPEKVDECLFFVGRKAEHELETGRKLLLAVLSHIHFLTNKGLSVFLSRFLPGQSIAENWPEWEKVFSGFPLTTVN
jgi:hypothetical protein